MLIKEKTLIFDWEVIHRNVGFRSPWPVRMKLALLALVGKVQVITVDDMVEGISAKGYAGHAPYIEYVTEVKRFKIKTQPFLSGPRKNENQS